MKLFLTGFFILFQSLYAFPIDLTKDWNYSFERYIPGKELDWKFLEILPVTENPPGTSNSQGLIYISYRRIVSISDEDKLQLKRDLPSLHIPFIASYYEIYWNGLLVKSCGRIENNLLEEVCIRRHLLIPLELESLKSGENTLHIVTAAEEGMDLGISPSTNDEIFSMDTYTNHLWIVSERVTLMLAFLYFFMAFYHALFFIKRPVESYNLYYSLFSLFLAVYIYSRSNAVFEVLGEGIFLKRLEYIVVYFIPAFFLFFIERFFIAKISVFSVLYFVFVTIDALLTAVSPMGYLNQLLRVWQISILYVLIHCIVVSGIAIYRKNPDIKRLMIGIITLIIAASWDVLGALNLFGLQNLGLMRYGFFIFVSGIAFILANRFLRVHKEVEILNQELEKKVEERTEKLKESLDEIQKLKIQQDGDYFLTSLLINPLSRNAIKDSISNFDVQFFCKQKKEFEFRGKKMEIGGDINIVDRVTLRGREYIVFVNGDAMGKSMQGAGGALVLGVIFHSIVTRSNKRKEGFRKGPEIWLRDCHQELQNVFETFDGSMLISVVMGMIDTLNGFMFFINAEHPWVVLYRDGKAEFLENSMELRKIGTMGIEYGLRVKTMQLEAGDVVYIGSDGRDDVVLSYGPDRERLMNEDETLFLKCIEEGKGEIHSTIQSILSKGDLSDDLSLIRIEYSPNLEELEKLREEKRKRFEYLYDLARTALKNRDYAAASVNFSLIADEYPDNLESYYFASYAFKKKKDFLESLNFAERLYLRNPEHLKNLLNLADLYRITANYDKSSIILQKVEEMSPGNTFAKKIRFHLDSTLKEIV